MFDFVDKNSLKKFELKNDVGLKFDFLENGAVFSLMRGETIINQVLGSPLEGALNNLYLRVFSGDKITAFSLLGPKSTSDFFHTENAVLWKGVREDLEYSCRLRLDQKTTLWFWTVSVKNLSPKSKKIDTIFTQDLGIALMFGVRINEAYTSQYIDHTVFKDKKFGYQICSRQNQAQGREYPWIMHGCLDQAVGYLTDGFQFFGLDYKASNQPEALKNKTLPNKVYQYEFAFPTLQSKAIVLAPRKETTITFFALYEPNHPPASQPGDARKIKKAAEIYRKLDKMIDLAQYHPVKKNRSLFDTAPLFAGKDLNAADLDHYFGKTRRHAEKNLSFFYGKNSYVSLQAKELVVERPHGHIIRSGKDLQNNENLMSLTSWVYGIFSSQVTIGNTSFNKLLSASRSHLNVLKSSGQRIFIKEKNGYQLFGLPSAFEMGLNYCRWIYKGSNGVVAVKVWASMQDPACFLELEVLSGKKKEFLISHNVVLGNNELETTGRVVIDRARGRVELIPAPKEFLTNHYPETKFFIVSNDRAKIESIAGDRLLFHDGQERKTPFVVIKTKAVKKFSLAFTGNILNAKQAEVLAEKYSRQTEEFSQAEKASADFWAVLGQRAVLSSPKPEEGISKLNDIYWWYLHNALVHFTTPHGLEQCSGAAYGLRDVCQGPAELFYATRNLPVLRELLKLVFSHQYRQTGDWPQWFMFDRYQTVQASDSHGDIIIWPLKAVCEYLELTNDFSILEERVVYTDARTKLFTKESYSIFSHLKKEIAGIRKNCLPGTSLISYGHGDWEDTLQPAESSMRQRMVSTWTVELVYQTLKRFQQVCARAGKKAMAEEMKNFTEAIRRDFNRYLIKNKVVAGLAYFRKKKIEYLLHPLDKKTGVKYRLLPMTRGMISGLFTKEQAEQHLKLIEKNLKFPDGAHLMNKPIPYRGGVEKYFKRAETAANFGREIGMQYVHAHIRYLEALAKMGKAEVLYQGLLEINPITIDKVVPNALTRQSNAYFSSSDADFKDRYEAMAKFSQIKKLQVGIKGGWRIYSSGPGIYIYQLLASFLGLRELFDDILLDPVLPRKLHGLIFDFEYFGRQTRFQYFIKQNVYSPYSVSVNGTKVENLRYEENPYRRGGALINRETFLNLLNKENNLVEIYL
ncbi:MAG: cellobiose phosphorylase [Elusimicrobiota bacterium]